MISIHEKELTPGTIVQHFKRETLNEDDYYDNKYLYMILYIGRYSETFEKMVVYRALYDWPENGVAYGDVFIRPYNMFISKVDHQKYPDIKQQYRFEKVNATIESYIKERM